jgi:hypothetical protein
MFVLAFSLICELDICLTLYLRFHTLILLIQPLPHMLIERKRLISLSTILPLTCSNNRPRSCRPASRSGSGQDSSDPNPTSHILLSCTVVLQDGDRVEQSHPACSGRCTSTSLQPCIPERQGIRYPLGMGGVKVWQRNNSLHRLLLPNGGYPLNFFLRTIGSCGLPTKSPVLAPTSQGGTPPLTKTRGTPTPRPVF